MLQTLQLSDSALPVGSMSHSFGLETLVFDEDIEPGLHGGPASLAWYLEDSLAESLQVDAVFCREARTRGIARATVVDLNRQMSALRLSRESRDASLAMGRRFAALVAAMQPVEALRSLADDRELHHSVAFGYTLGVLGVEQDVTVAAFLHQCLLNTISAAQRLLPLGQMEANRIAWDLKPAVLEAVQRSSAIAVSAAGAFAHLPETASMRHPSLPTRLFIS